MNYWDYEDEFIQHDREQLIKQVWSTPEERKENYEYQKWLNRQRSFNKRKLEVLGKSIITDTPEQTNDGILCMYCSKYCPTWEVVYTGDPDSYEGKEIWCYCDECKTDTFHRLEKRHFNETTTDNSLYTNTQKH